MKLLIAGPRTMDDYKFAKEQIYYFVRNDHIEVVVSGACSDKKGKLTYTRPDGTEVYGGDGLGEKWAAENGIPVESHPADWNKYGLSAGPIRNGKMALRLEPKKDKALVFYNSESKGSKDMIAKARKREAITEAIEIPK
jgi:hypothetical protein